MNFIVHIPSNLLPYFPRHLSRIANPGLGFPFNLALGVKFPVLAPFFGYLGMFSPVGLFILVLPCPLYQLQPLWAAFHTPCCHWPRGPGLFVCLLFGLAPGPSSVQSSLLALLVPTFLGSRSPVKLCASFSAPPCGDPYVIDSFVLAWFRLTQS